MVRDDITVTRASLPPYEEFIEAIRPLWDSRRLTNMGSYHRELEMQLCRYLGVPYVSLMVNGHMSLEMVIQAFEFPKGSEVITTPFTFVSTTHAIIRSGLSPIFCDIKLSDYTIDEDQIEELITEKTVAILPVHVYGNVCNIERIEEIANKHGLKVIYDAAHAFGEAAGGVGVGNFGDASIFSFHATKVFHTIEGGAVATSNKELYDKLCDLRNFGIRSEELVVEIGANAKLNELCAIMGLCNLGHLEQNVQARKERAEYYILGLQSESALRCPHYLDEIRYSYGYFPILFLPEFCGKGMRDRIYDALKKRRIYSRKYFYPLSSDEACFKNKYQSVNLENARYAAENILALPLYPEMEYSAIDEVIQIIKENLITNDISRQKRRK